ncbi:MAG: tetratricopeptide repeat protein [Planctomycetes bacterium]|nr:tetratricopeptide repeat protein [Planctomycetota bacterium]
MADELKPDADAWGQQDWATDEVRPKVPPTRGKLGFAIAAVVGLVLLIGMFLWMRAQETARDLAEREHRMVLEEQLRAERVKAEQVQADALPNPKPPEEPPLDPAEALRLIARDPEALNNAGLFLLNQLDEPDEAIEKFQEAVKLDPKYAANLELARKRQAQKDRTAPFPRAVEEPR